jgi:bifunctional non-homologous end joining protein LigD
MAKLDVYRAKRDFGVTPEPPAGRARARTAGPPTFMVHKHHARSLHYDLRLEMEGVLASWAVPKGPSYDPGQKRLAMQTEDHPLAYGGFEGRIPDGEYGAGDSIIWDRGTWETVPPGQAAEQRRKGRMLIDLQGEKLAGRWHLIRTRPSGGKPAWLLFKAKDETSRPAYDVVAARPESVASGRRVTRGPVAAKSLRAPHPAPLQLLARIWPPMLATLADAGEVGQGYRLEVKYDGFRALAAVSGRQISVQSRNALDLSARFPAVPAALGQLVVGEAVLDGEIVAHGHGSSRFQALQGGPQRVDYVAFDLLWLEGEDLRPRPLRERRELLESLLAGAPEGIRLSEEVSGPIDRALARAKQRGWEGLVAKVDGAPYRGGRSRDWLKVKVAAGQEVAIVGYTAISTGENAIGALLVAVADRGRFVYAGKVGTGYTAQVRRALYRKLAPDRVDAPQVEGAPRVAGARWVKPRWVAQVGFTEWTAGGRMRHPSFQGLREDKKPEETVREVPASRSRRS